MNREITFVGEVHTPYKAIEDCPFNIDESGPLCSLEVYPKYIKGLIGLHPGNNILILYWLNYARRVTDVGYPYIGAKNELRGTFARRTPHRPNPIGAATIRIIKIEKNTVYVRGLDCLDGTKLIDIKPAILKE